MKRFAFLLAAVVLLVFALAAPAEVLDPNGVLLKPIPDRLVVLTFDDAPASHATIVTPILKELGFGGSFYVCDFDSFHTRKDWYMTYRQMKAMAEDGFEIGNHTVGHGGGLENYLRMEDQLLANHVPKPTTVCWPVYQPVKGIYADLTAHGYTFGRGGHERPYLPTVDNPFDVPSYTIRDGISVETFAKKAQLACQGRVVVFCFHGLPDMEHPPVSLEPETFKAMMRYLKDNRYQCIALRDLAKFIDATKAVKLPTTVRELKDAAPFTPLKDEKPYVAQGAAEILSFTFAGLPPVKISRTNLSVTVPHSTNLAALIPTISVSAGATLTPTSGAAGDFTEPKRYVVKGPDGSTKSYTVTVSRAAVSGAKEVLEFALAGAASTSVSGDRVAAYVPASQDVTALMPTFTLAPLATLAPPSGTSRDFTTPQTYKITAQDGSSREIRVVVVKTDQASAFTWKQAESGNWSDASKWLSAPPAGATPNAAGGADYAVNFKLDGKYVVENDLDEGFQLNQFNLVQTRGLTLSGKAISFVASKLTGLLPQINVLTPSESDHINLPLNLTTDTAVNVKLRGRLTVEGLISGSGGLILNCPGATDEEYTRWGILRIDNKINTYSGGTIINGGQLFLFVSNQGLGTGPVTLNPGGDLRMDNVKGANPLFINGGTMEGGGSWNAAITLNGNARFAGHISFNEISGGITGPGSFTQIGSIGAFARVNVGEIALWGVNSYKGPTTVRMGTLILKRVVALYGGDSGSWTAANITVHPAATLQLSAGGPGEFSGQLIGTLLKSLTASVNNNGLMARAVFCIDTAKATGLVNIDQDLSDSKGPGGGAYLIRKIGAGTLQLSGDNTYTGPTVLESGALSVASLNSVAQGKPASSLGAPNTVEAGEIFIGKGDGECGLIYTGTGESSDRVLNLAGKKSTFTLDHTGSGLLKLTSSFVISGYGHSKVIVLQGGAAGRGELAGDISDPHDRAFKATTSITKSGAGVWILSGNNTFSGPTDIKAGTLSLANKSSLGPKTDVTIHASGILDLPFQERMTVHSLTVDGKVQPEGEYGSAQLPDSIRGPGVLVVRR